MPTVLRESGFRFMIYTEDHAPMHVHAWHQGRQVIINFEGNVAVRENYGLNQERTPTGVEHCQTAAIFFAELLERNSWIVTLTKSE